MGEGEQERQARRKDVGWLDSGIGQVCTSLSVPVCALADPGLTNRSFKEDEALAVLQRFVRTYPPTSLRSPIRPPSDVPYSALAPPRPSALAFPAVPIRLASPLYPETSPSLDPLRAPHLTFPDLALLHKRLADVEDTEGLALVKWAAKSYEGSIRMARRKERREEGTAMR